MNTLHPEFPRNLSWVIEPVEFGSGFIARAFVMGWGEIDDAQIGLIEALREEGDDTGDDDYELDFDDDEIFEAHFGRRVPNWLAVEMHAGDMFLIDTDDDAARLEQRLRAAGFTDVSRNGVK